jgi:acetyl esterase/lipase
MDGEMRALRAFLAAQPERSASIAEERRRDRAAAAGQRLPAEAVITSLALAGVPADRVVMPESTADRVVLHFHAGGYVYRSALEYRPFGAALARAATATVYLLDYRLAPEHVFPAAFDDAWAAYGALLDQGIAANRIVLSGDSAGGGLVLAVLQAARDRRRPLPAAAVVGSPWTDLTCSSDTYRTLAATDPRAVRDRLFAIGQMYLAGADARDPRASPAFGRFEGLPPTLILVGSDEAMLGDALLAYGAMRAAGGDVRLEVWPDMIHIWHIYADRLTAGRRAIERMGEFCRRALAPHGSRLASLAPHHEEGKVPSP